MRSANTTDRGGAGMDTSAQLLRLDTAAYPGQTLCRYPFSSGHSEFYPRIDYEDSGSLFQALLRYYLQQNRYSDQYLFRHLQLADRSIEENMNFEYLVIKPHSGPRFNGAVLLFHGLNEKSWKKYIPWAQRLCAIIGRPVILFPIAFHMDRAPADWSAPRKMIPVARERQQLFPDLKSCSFVNAALSHRIQFAPHRFLTSGLHSIFDAVDLIAGIRAGEHPLFSVGASVDLFGYSIGATLAELLLFIDPHQLLSDSRAFLFCGGSVLNEARPVSRTIIDGEAHRELLSFFRNLFKGTGHLGSHLRNLSSGCLHEIEWFKALLFQERMRTQREERLRETSHRIAAVVMEQDTVFSPEAVRTTLQGADGSIPVDILTCDLPFHYTHENPLPLDSDEPEEVEKILDTVMERASGLYQYI